MYGLVFSLLFYCFSVSAQLKVQLLDQSLDSKKINPKNNHIEIINPNTNQSRLPTTKDRDKFFSQFQNLKTFYQSLDQVDRDLLWINLKHKEISQLEVKYPQIAKEDILVMKKKIKASNI